MEHRKSENRTQQQKQQPTTVTILMLICRVDTHPNQGFWTKLRPRGLSTRFFVVEKPGTRPLRLERRKSGWTGHVASTWSKSLDLDVYPPYISSSNVLLELDSFLKALLNSLNAKLPSYRNRSIDFQSKSIEWFLYDGNFGD